MKNLLILITAILVMTTGCKKKDDPKPVEGPKIIITVKFSDGSAPEVGFGSTFLNGWGNGWYYNTSYPAGGCDANGQTTTIANISDSAIIITASAINTQLGTQYISEADTIYGPFTAGQVINRTLIVK